MKLETQRLLSVLKACRSGLSKSDVIPALSCFCFYRNEVITFDDVVSIVAPFPMEGFAGGFNGELLLNWLSLVKTEQVTFTEDGGAGTWKTGRSRLELPVLSSNDFVFTIPRKEYPSISLGSDFLDLLKIASASRGVDLSHPWRLGVTLQLLPDSLVAYSTDNLVVERIEIPCEVSDELSHSQVILPPRLLEVLLSNKVPIKLSLGERVIRFDYDDGCLVFCKLIPDVVDSSKFESAMDSVSWNDDESFYEITEEFEASLNAAEVILKGSAEPECRARVKSGNLTISAMSARGDCSDVMELKNKAGSHPDVEVHFNPVALKRVLPFADQLQILPSMLAVRSDCLRARVSVISN